MNMIILQIKTKGKNSTTTAITITRRREWKSQRRKDRLLNRNKVSEFSSPPFLQFPPLPSTNSLSLHNYWIIIFVYDFINELSISIFCTICSSSSCCCFFCSFFCCWEKEIESQFSAQVLLLPDLVLFSFLFFIFCLLIFHKINKI